MKKVREQYHFLPATLIHPSSSHETGRQKGVILTQSTTLSQKPNPLINSQTQLPVVCLSIHILCLQLKVKCLISFSAVIILILLNFNIILKIFLIAVMLYHCFLLELYLFFAELPVHIVVNTLYCMSSFADLVMSGFFCIHISQSP